MRKIFFTYYTGYCGSDGHEVAEFDDNVTDQELDRYSWEAAVENAGMYGIYPTEDAPEEYYDDNYEGDEEYSDNIEGTWCDYVEEKHEGYVS